MAQGGISLLSMTAANAEDPQTLRMVAGAVANLCGNGKTSATFDRLLLHIFLMFTPYYFIDSHVQSTAKFEVKETRTQTTKSTVTKIQNCFFQINYR